LTHPGGAELPGAPHANPDNPPHLSDCADLLCYNDTDIAGQTYDSCPVPWTEFTQNVWSQSRPAYRLDCGRDDYFAWRSDGSGLRDPVDGYCPPGVTRPGIDAGSSTHTGAATVGQVVAAPVRTLTAGLDRRTGTPVWRITGPQTVQAMSCWVAAIVRSR
jgi:hypothetical protein